ncbi:MAG TPA: metallophosphoesterase [Gemmatimonadaceae bacterium]|nr:metallophosphoesterase [Gemmatimonadaceae bacterium]
MTALLWAAGAALLLLAIHATVLTHFDLRVTEVVAPIDGLPEEFSGYTIAVLADVHYGPPTGARVPRRAVDIAHRASPDLVVLLGDYGLSYDSALWLSRILYRSAYRGLAPILRRITARDGVLAVLGNHDYDVGADTVRSWLRSLGVDVLVNDCRIVRRGNASLAIGGVDDFKKGTVDPMGGCHTLPAGAPHIVLSHSPDAVRVLDRRVRVDLVLAGHTHGGQVVIPGYGAPLRFCKVCGPRTAKGWVPNDRAPLYVSAGVGAAVPLRFNCPPEVVIVRLERQGQQPA